ncbi:serine hydrolase domain-containing protein [Actinomycetes bacterium KLBMP 9797]
MSDQPRPLPDRPNLRYVKLEAKRRLATGEFATLHDAQLAIAREYGLQSWTALKRLIDAQTTSVSGALTQLRWVISRFAGADSPEWTAPDEEELRGHFNEAFLTAVGPSTVVSTMSDLAAQLREELIVAAETLVSVRARIADLQIEAAAETRPPHRLTGLLVYPVPAQVTDPRVKAPSIRTSGHVPPAAVAAAAESFAELGLVALAMAGAAGDGDAGWAAAHGWASLERAEALRTDHQFPAYSITKLITSTVVLRLVADGRLRLDDPANRHLRTVRLEDDTVTVRELLTHTGGVHSPGELFADRVPDLMSLVGPRLACGGPRGTFAYSNGGYAMLGQLIADVTESAYDQAATRLVLQPLGMNSSSFPITWPSTDSVTEYLLTPEGLFEPAPNQMVTLPAAGGLWTTAPDLVTFGLTWASLLPDDLASEALRPHAERDSSGAQIGLGWLLHQAQDVCGHAGGGPNGSSSLLIRLSTGQTSVTLTNRLIPIEPVNLRLIKPIT